MSRLLALLALLACAHALPTRHLATTTHPLTPFVNTFTPWEEYDDPYETFSTQFPRLPRPSAKVILRTENAKFNKTVKNTKRNNKKKVVKSTTVSIESYANFVLTKRPNDMFMVSKPMRVTKAPQKLSFPSSPRPPSSSRPPSSRRPPSTQQRSKKRRTAAPRPPVTTTTRRPTTTAQRRTQSTTTKRTEKIPCPPKHAGWISSFFEQKKVKKSPNKQQNQSWIAGVFSQIYGWVWRKHATWFGDDGQNTKNKNKIQKTTSTTTTTEPSTYTNVGGWFQNFINTEEKESITDTQSPKTTNKKSYKGYQMLRTYPDVDWKVKELLELKEDSQGSGLMWWTPPTINSSTDMLVPPDLLYDVKDQLKSSKIHFDIIIKDLQNAIKYENPRLSKKQRLEMEQTQGHPMTWRRYHRYADILRYLEYLQHAHADKLELVPLGRSSQGLPLVAVKVSMPSNETNDQELGYKKKWKLRSRMKPALWIDAGAHAREWIAPAVATWIIHNLVEEKTDPDEENEILKRADFYIMPVLNPDGYEHSHRKDRLWMKTRSQPPEPSEDYYDSWLPWNWGKTECIGVNADRNWDYRFGEGDSSKDPCSENYAGPHPFSEPETQAVSDFLLEKRGQIKVYLTLHAYQQAWMVPSSLGQPYYSVDPEAIEMGKLAAAAQSDIYGTKYKVGTAAEIRQPASGMAHDWAARAGIKYSYHVELPESIGQYGFLLPGSQIVPTARETWQAIKAIVDNLT